MNEIKYDSTVKKLNDGIYNEVIEIIEYLTDVKYHNLLTSDFNDMRLMYNQAVIRLNKIDKMVKEVEGND